MIQFCLFTCGKKHFPVRYSLAISQADFSYLLVRHISMVVIDEETTALATFVYICTNMDCWAARRVPKQIGSRSEKTRRNESSSILMLDEFLDDRHRVLPWNKNSLMGSKYQTREISLLFHCIWRVIANNLHCFRSSPPCACRYLGLKGYNYASVMVSCKRSNNKRGLKINLLNLLF